MVAIVRAVTNSTTLAASRASKCSASATETMTKANSPPGPSSSPVRSAFAQFTPKMRVSGVTTSNFNTTTPAAEPRTSNGSATSGADIEAHADGDQKHANKQPLERVDSDLNLSAIFRTGQQQAADQRAKSHGQAGGGRREPGSDHDEQARCGE